MDDINQYNLDSKVWGKFDSNLRQKIIDYQADPSIELPVMIVLAGSTEPFESSQVRNRRASFEQENADLIQKLEQLGARDLQLFWINRTVSAKLKLPAIKAIGGYKEVERILLIVRQKVIVKPTHKKED